MRRSFCVFQGVDGSSDWKVKETVGPGTCSEARMT
jgi:hypothetical protein